MRLSAFSLLFVLAGCGQVFSSYDVAPNGLTRADYQFRHFLSAGHADSALLQLSKPAKKSRLPKDDLLRMLYEGVAAHYASDYQRSASVFDKASLVCEDRSTKSLSRAALSILVNDLSLAYEPSRTERLLLPYYSALGYAQSGNITGAAVEARRLAALLESLGEPKVADERRLFGFFRYFAGVLFEAAGEENDAGVAYRNALALNPASPVDFQSPADSMGEVVVFIEHGFAPHRVQESLIVVLGADERRGFHPDRSEEERRATAQQVATRVLDFANSARPRTGPPRAHALWVPAPTQSKASTDEAEKCDSACKKQKDDDDDTYLLRLSWPVMFTPADAVRPATVTVDSMTVTTQLAAPIDGAVLADFHREQPAIVSRTIARAATKYALTKSARKSAGKHEGLGSVLGILTNVSGAITEQADTRSWHLVPGTISMVRVRVKAGAHALKFDTGNGVVDLGTVNVQPGRIALISKRVWN